MSIPARKSTIRQDYPSTRQDYANRIAQPAGRSLNSCLNSGEVHNTLTYLRFLIGIRPVSQNTFRGRAVFYIT
jgi:hypothetical protein